MKFAKSRVAKASIIVGLSVVLIAAIAFFCISSRSDRTAAIIAKWRPSVVMVSCQFFDQSGHDTFPSESGVLMRDEQGGIFVVTNFGVYNDGEQFAADCLVTDDGSLSIRVLPKDFATTTASAAGVLKLPNENAGALRGRALPGGWCGNDTAVGDRVVILGHASAVKTTMIATEGMLSGYQMNDRYLTTAYIDEGLFGGAAIDATRDCYLGMPGIAAPGGTGELGEIWKWQSFKDALPRE